MNRLQYTKTTKSVLHWGSQTDHFILSKKHKYFILKNWNSLHFFKLSLDHTVYNFQFCTGSSVSFFKFDILIHFLLKCSFIPRLTWLVSRVLVAVQGWRGSVWGTPACPRSPSSGSWSADPAEHRSSHQTCCITNTVHTMNNQSK